MVFDVPDVCITERAEFQFHMAYYGYWKLQADKKTVQFVIENDHRLTAQYLYNHYPIWVRSWIKQQGGLRKDDQKTINMPYSYAKQYMPTCGRS